MDGLKKRYDNDLRLGYVEGERERERSDVDMGASGGGEG